MTNVIIIGEQTKKKELKPIEFILFLHIDKGVCEASKNAKSFKNIELICREYTNQGLDLMFAYNNDRNEGILYLGHFNDGVV
jgi:hypothetical protein